jgi:UDP-GlcNAc:undecaprenyl-phosphate GlcNAc-1-phosphate transferase
VWTALLSAFVLYPVLSGQNPTYLPFGMLAISVVLFTVLHPSVRRLRRANGNGHVKVDVHTRSAQDRHAQSGQDPVASSLSD